MRHIVIPVDFSAADDRAFLFFSQSLRRPGDVVDIVHVVKAAEPVTEIYHGATCPGCCLPGLPVSLADLW
jgi:uncharacterized membrane protein YebE (DUF533 family)